jgi:hypothetical protein
MSKDATSSENFLQVNKGAPTMCLFTPKGGKDECAWMENSQGPRWKDRKFMHKDALSWSRGWRPQNNTNEGVHVQNVKMIREEENRTEPAQKGPRPVGLVGSAQPVVVPIRAPFFGVKYVKF